jgi:flagellar assembly protein FliH
LGKIVRGAKVLKETYVLEVPEFEAPPETGFIEEPDDSFAASGDDLEFDDDTLYGSDALESEIVEPPVDVEQVRADARALIDRAAADAESMLRDAADRAKDLVAQANARVADIEAQARAQGHDEGLAAGRAAGHAELEEDIATMHELIDGVRAQRNAVIESAEPELVSLAMAVAERIVYDHVAIDPNIVLENVRHALTRISGREIVTLRVNPADLGILRQYRESTAASNDVEHLRIVEDQRVDRGGVVIETDAGTIDAKVSTQLREARRALTNGDTIPQAS